MALVGNLKDLKLPNLIQLNCMEKNKAKLSIESRNLKGEIYFDNGQILHAKANNEEGEKAVFALLQLKEGLFRVENGIDAEEQTVFNNWSNLLLDSLRVIDEEKDTEKGQIEDKLKTLLAMKGISDAEILDKKGRIIASSVPVSKREGYSYLLSFSYKEADFLAETLGMGALKYINLKTPKSKVAAKSDGTHYYVIEYESKLQVENISAEFEKI